MSAQCSNDEIWIVITLWACCSCCRRCAECHCLRLLSPTFLHCVAESNKLGQRWYHFIRQRKTKSRRKENIIRNWDKGMIDISQRCLHSKMRMCQQRGFAVWHPVQWNYNFWELNLVGWQAQQKVGHTGFCLQSIHAFFKLLISVKDYSNDRSLFHVLADYQQTCIHTCYFQTRDFLLQNDNSPS